MGFFSKLKKVLPQINKGAILASAVLPGKAGQVASQVGETTGVVTAIVTQIHADSPDNPARAATQSALATAVAVDDHEERMKVLEAEIQRLSSHKK